MSKVKEEALAVLSQELPVDMKLTRGEVIDLIIDSTVQDLETQVKDLEVQIKEANSFKITQAQLLKHFKDVEFNLQGWNNDISLVTKIPLPNEFIDQLKARDALVKQQRNVRTALNQFNNRAAAKTAILRNLLNGTEKGRDLLGRLDKLKIDLKTKALQSAAQMTLQP
jgi:hypothetical protein